MTPGTKAKVREISIEELDRELAVGEAAFDGTVQKLIARLDRGNCRIVPVLDGEQRGTGNGGLSAAWCTQKVQQRQMTLKKGSRSEVVVRGREIEDTEEETEEEDAAADPLDSPGALAGADRESAPQSERLESEIPPRATVIHKFDPSLLATYRAEVRKIPVMTREDEQVLARRVEFLRLRMERALEACKLDQEAISCAVRCPCETPGDISGRSCPGGCFDRLKPLDRRVALNLHLRCCEFNRSRNEMIERSLHLVLRLIDRYRGLGVPTLDLIQEGNASLFKAVERFDWRRAVRFRTYATYWINQAFLNQIYNSSRTVRVPAYIQKAMKKINDAFMRLGEADPEVGTLAREANLPDDLVRSALNGNRYSFSLDRELEGNDGGKVLDAIEDPGASIDFEAMEEISLPTQLQKVMEILSEREQMVLCLRYGIGVTRSHTLAEVGERLGISLERVRQIQEAALARLRGPHGRRLLSHFRK